MPDVAVLCENQTLLSTALTVRLKSWRPYINTKSLGNTS